MISTKFDTEAVVEDILLSRLVAERQPVLFLGESTTRSLPTALAVMRGSYQDIWATTFERPRIANATSARGYCSRAAEIRQKNADWLERTLPAYDDKFEQDQDPPEGVQTVTFPQRLNLRADATNLAPFYSSYPSAPRKNVWFQCPFIGRKRMDSTAMLIIQALHSISAQQDDGDVLIIGILSSFSKFYGIDRITSEAASLGYIMFKDVQFIQKCIRLGYVHETVAKTTSLHAKVLNEHITYVFLKWRGVYEDETPCLVYGDSMSSHSDTSADALSIPDVLKIIMNPPHRPLAEIENLDEPLKPDLENVQHDVTPLKDVDIGTGVGLRIALDEREQHEDISIETAGQRIESAAEEDGQWPKNLEGDWTERAEDIDLTNAAGNTSQTEAAKRHKMGLRKALKSIIGAMVRYGICVKTMLDEAGPQYGQIPAKNSMGCKS